MIRIIDKFNAQEVVTHLYRNSQINNDKLAAKYMRAAS